MKTIRWAIIGGGDIAQKAIAPALGAARNAQLVAVANRRLDTAQAFAQRNGLSLAFDSLDALLARDDVDAVYIATPNALHAEHTIAAARAGKHVLCDKPMALTEQECERMIEVCETADRRLGVVFQNRFHPAHLEARARVREGLLGEVQFARAQFCNGRTRGHFKGWRLDPQMSNSGAIAAVAIHAIDLLRFVLDSEIVEVQGMTDVRLPERPMDEMCIGSFRFANGTLAQVLGGTIVPRSDNDVVLHGSQARITCRNTLGAQLEDPRQEFRLQAPGGDVVQDHSANTGVDRFARMIEHFGDCIADGSEPVFSGRNGLQMVRVGNAMLESSRSGRTVPLV